MLIALLVPPDGDNGQSNCAFDKSGIVSVQFKVRNAFGMSVCGESECYIENGYIKGKPDVVMEDGTHN